ncbi:MAG: hypothetical protein ABL904_25795 [Hyphomicrobiaceae bacterium]
MRSPVIFCAAIALLLSACGKELLEFQKPGVSRTAMLKDDEKCWAEAHRKKGLMTEAEKSKNVVEGAVTMGVLGVVGAAAVNAGADDPRGAHYRLDYNNCMREKGYGLGMAQN